MAKQEECTKCKKARQDSFGEIKCSFYGRKPQFNGESCPNYWDRNTERCPECGQEVSPTASICPNCGYPLKKESPQKSNSTQSDNTTNTTKKSKKAPLYALLLILGLGVLIGLSVYIISNDGPMRYTIKLSDDYVLPFGVEINAFECDENGDKIYENKFSLEQKGESKTFTAQSETKKIKVRVSTVDISRLGTSSYVQKNIGWLPLVYILSPNETKEIEIGNMTEYSYNEP